MTRLTLSKAQGTFFTQLLIRFDDGNLAALIRDKSCAVNMQKALLWSGFTDTFNKVGNVFCYYSLL